MRYVVIARTRHCWDKTTSRYDCCRPIKQEPRANSKRENSETDINANVIIASHEGEKKAKKKPEKLRGWVQWKRILLLFPRGEMDKVAVWSVWAEYYAPRITRRVLASESQTSIPSRESRFARAHAHTHTHTNTHTHTHTHTHICTR